ncbi:MAG: SH3 domain-containing protein, partial [Planctomycetota bacterium]
TCWVSKKLVEVKENNKGVIKGKSVNVRVSPDKASSGNIIGDLDENTEVTITGEKNDWYKISSPKSLSAWVAKKHTKFVMKYEDYKKWLAEENAKQTVHKQKEDELNQKFETAEQVYDSIDFNQLNFEDIKQLKKVGGDLAHIRALYAEVVEYSANEEVAVTARDRVGRLDRTIELYSQTVDFLGGHQADIKRIRENFQREYERIMAEQNPPPKQYLAQGFIDSVGKYKGRPGTHQLVKGGETLVYLESGSDDINLDDYFKKYVGVNGERREIKDASGKAEEPLTVITVKEIILIK